MNLQEKFHPNPIDDFEKWLYWFLPMTPAQRQKMWRLVLTIVLLFSAGVATRIAFNAGNIPSRLMGRGKGDKPSGAPLLKDSPASLAPLSFDGKPGIRVSSEKEIVSSGGKAEKMDFTILGKWKYIEGKTKIPDTVKTLDGKIFEFTGFMMPINEVKNITQFILIQSLWGCCFGQAPEANHIVVVHMERGKTVDFYPDLIRVTGRFSVGETREEGYLVSIYRLDASKVEAK